MNLLESIIGEIRSIEEWQQECTAFFKNLNIAPSNQWERYKKALRLQPVGIEREWDGRKPVNITTQLNREDLE